MARIKYDRYLLGDGELITITNADTDGFMETVPESFTNPPLRITFLRLHMSSLEESCRYYFEYHNENNPDFNVSPADGARMLRGELPGWRLVGLKFAPELGLWGYCANEQMSTDGQNDTGIMIRFADDIEVEVEVDYADGLPVRRYICKIGDNSSGYATEITEYLGKRKVRKLGYSENEPGEDDINGWLCHITEY